MENEHPVNVEPLIQEKKSNRLLKFFRRLVYTISFLLLLLTGAGFIIAFYYGEEVKSYIIGELNKQLDTPVIVDTKDIDFSVLRNFPNASLEFRNVKALDAVKSEKKDTLFSAGVISLQFNIMDIFHENYHIKKIALENVNLNIRIDKKGNDNYHFLKKPDSTAVNKESQALDFSIEKIEMKNLAVRYTDRRSKQDYFVVARKAQLSGKFSDEQYSLISKGELLVHHLRSDSTYYLKEKDTRYTLELDVNKEVYTFKNADVKISDLDFNVAGSIDGSSKTSVMDLIVKGKDMDIQSLVSLLPEKQREKFSDYESEGNFYFKSTITGPADKVFVKAAFGIEKGTITQRSSSVTLSNVDMEGSFQNDALYDVNHEVKSRPNLDIKAFKANLGDGSISGKLNIENFDNPEINASLNGSISLGDLNKFLKMDTVESVSGQLKINATYRGKIKDRKKYMSGDFNDVKAAGEMSVTNVFMRLKDNPLKFDSIDGSFLFNNNDIVINDFKGKMSNTDFQLKGFFRNILSYFFLDKETLTVEATFKSANLDLNEILSDKNSSDKNSNAYTLKLSQFIDLNLNSDIKHITFRKFEATNMKGTLKMKDSRMIADPLSFSTMDGDVLISGMVDGSNDDKLLITCDASLRKININKMFYQFENFGQDYVQDKNLKGIGTAEVQFASVWSPQLDIDLDKIYVRSDLTIEKGELVKFEPMQELSRFIKVSELENIRFSKLQNQIEIKNQTIYIPKMEISTSALNITASGTHTFSNVIDYRVKVLLGDLLSKKARRAKKENNEFGVVEDDGLGKTALYLSMTGTVENPVIKYDSKSAVEKIKADLKTEKQTLKTILKEEFGWFKKDTAATQGKKPAPVKEDNSKFIIKWDEEEQGQKKDDDDDF